MAVTIPDLEAKIKAKAHTEVESAWALFCLCVENAVKTLMGMGQHGRPSHDDFRSCLDRLSDRYCSVSMDKRKGLPKAIWTTREDSIRNSILGTMDTLQQVLKVQNDAEQTVFPKEQE